MQLALTMSGPLSLQILGLDLMVAWLAGAVSLLAHILLYPAGLEGGSGGGAGGWPNAVPACGLVP